MKYSLDIKHDKKKFFYSLAHELGSSAPYPRPGAAWGLQFDGFQARRKLATVPLPLGFPWISKTLALKRVGQ